MVDLANCNPELLGPPLPDSYRVSINDSALVLLIPAWGAGIDMLRDWALPSLMQLGNLPSLMADGVEIHLQGFTKPGEKEVLAHLFRDVPFRSMTVYEDPDPLLQMCHLGPKSAFEQSRRVLFCSADQIWGDGTISNVWNYARGKPVVVAVPHLRVVESRWKEKWKINMMGFPISNKGLVRAGLDPDCIHSSQHCWSSDDVNTTYNSGVSFTRINDRTVTVIHWLPSPLLCWFTAEDVEFFSKSEKSVLWDREWPSMVLEENRWRVIGSSQIAFGLELSKEASAARPESGRKHFEGYFESRPHNVACGSFVCSLEL